MHLEQQRLIYIFVASLGMNPGALHGTGLEVHDLLRGKKTNQDKSTAFCFADLRFSNSFNCANLLNLLSFRHEDFAGRYATRKIQTTSRVAQASVRKSDAHMHPQLHEIIIFYLLRFLVSSNFVSRVSRLTAPGLGRGLCIQVIWILFL